jgi:hypothetical protein
MLASLLFDPSPSDIDPISYPPIFPFTCPLVGLADDRSVFCYGLSADITMEDDVVVGEVDSIAREGKGPAGEVLNRRDLPH